MGVGRRQPEQQELLKWGGSALAFKASGREVATTRKPSGTSSSRTSWLTSSCRSAASLIPSSTALRPLQVALKKWADEG